MSYSNSIHSIIHDVHPAFECCNLKQREIGYRYIVEGDPGLEI